jgi:hypothetical protein
MPIYYWEEYFHESRDPDDVQCIVQTIEVSDGVLVYEATNGGYSSGCARSLADVIQLLETRRECLTEELANIDRVLEAAKTAHSCVDNTDYVDEPVDE